MVMGPDPPPKWIRGHYMCFGHLIHFRLCHDMLHHDVASCCKVTSSHIVRSMMIEVHVVQYNAYNMMYTYMHVYVHVYTPLGPFGYRRCMYTIRTRVVCAHVL